MRCKAALATVLACALLAPLPGAAQAVKEPPAVQWRLEVVRDGTTIDTFEGTTAIGQAVTATHHHETVHAVGCKARPDARIDLARTLTISPIAEEPGGIAFAIDAQETLEDDTPQQTRDGCTLPPQPRRVNANHPGLLVPAGQWASWTIVDSRPTLVYRVRASVAARTGN